MIFNKATEKNQMKIGILCVFYDLSCNMHTCEEI